MVYLHKTTMVFSLIIQNIKLTSSKIKSYFIGEKNKRKEKRRENKDCGIMLIFTPMPH
jgi:hypothetical protein